MDKHDCEHCYNYILRRGIFSEYICLEQDEKPEYIQAQRDTDGKACSYWQPKMQILVNGKRIQ